MNGVLVTTLRLRAHNAALDQVGNRYAHQGRSIISGLDCIGLVLHAYTTAGFSGVIPSNYREYGNSEILLIHLEKYCYKVDRPELGDIMVFRYKRTVQHVSMKTVIGMIHATKSLNMTVNEPINSFWRKRHMFTYRVKE